MSLHLSPILGHFCTLCSAIREKLFYFLQLFQFVMDKKNILKLLFYTIPEIPEV